MSEKPNENIQEAIGDTTKKSEKKSGAGLEISPSPELKKLSESIGTVKDLVDHNKPVELSQLQQIEEAVKKLTVDIGGEEMTLEELEKIPDLEKNMKIWEEIKQGNFLNQTKLTYITPEIAEILSHLQDRLVLVKLTSLSEKTAEHLSRHQGALILMGLTSLPDKVAEHLSHHKGDLDLRGLKFLSNQLAEYLSHHQGKLGLQGLTSLSDKAAEYLSRHQGVLYFKDLANISDNAAKHLARHRGKSFFPQAIKDQIYELAKGTPVE